MGRSTGEIELIWSHLVMLVYHFKTIQKLQRKNQLNVTIQTPFKTPGQNTRRACHLRDSPVIFPSILLKDNKHKMSQTTPSTSHSSHHFSPRSPSSSPPAQVSSRETLVCPTKEDHTAWRHSTFIWPQDVDTQLTTGLAALVQETSLLAPYKIQRSAKRKVRQAFSTRC